MKKTIINMKPLSVNEAFKGQRYKTDKYKAYEMEMLFRLPVITLPKPPFKVYYEFGFSNINSDWDNPVKPLQDILQKKYKFNDRDIYEATVRKRKVKIGYDYIIFSIESI